MLHCFVNYFLTSYRLHGKEQIASSFCTAGQQEYPQASSFLLIIIIPDSTLAGVHQSALARWAVSAAFPDWQPLKWRFRGREFLGECSCDWTREELNYHTATERPPLVLPRVLELEWPFRVVSKKKTFYSWWTSVLSCLCIIVSHIAYEKRLQGHCAMSHRMGYKITHVAFNNNINDRDYHLYSALVFTKSFHSINLQSLMRGRNYCKSEAERGEVIHASVQIL